MRRDLIVDAAICRIDADGLAAPCMRTLTRHVGISRALLYTVFDDKEALKLAAAVRLEMHFVAELQRATTEGDYLSPPAPLPANVVFDEFHGWIIEIILPNATPSVEHAVLLPLAELEALLGQRSLPLNYLRHI